MSRSPSKKRSRAPRKAAGPVGGPKARLTLRESEARRAAILDTALDSVIAMDHRGRIVDFNPAAERTFGYRRDEVIGKTLAETIVPPSLRESHRRGLARYLETGEGPVLGRRIELTGLRKDGTEFPVELGLWRDPAAREAVLEKVRTGEPIHNLELSLQSKTGQTRHVILSIETLPLGPEGAVLSAAVDVTEKKELEHRLLESERLAAMGRLTGYVAHEINTPLTNISLLAATAAKRSQDPEVVSRLEKINAQRRLIGSILQDLAGLTRPPPIQPAETDLRTIVDASLEQMEPYLHDGVELRKEVVSRAVIADVDPRRIQQVLVNLTKNALQATSSGAVTVGVEDRGETVAVIVQDTGPGMSPDVIEKLFQPFFTTKPKEQGTGLGLAFAKSVVGAHGGTIEVTSLPGHGSTFTVVLPKTPSPP